MGPFLFAELFLVGFYALAAMHYGILWAGTRQERTLLMISLLSAHGACLAWVIFRMITVETVADAQLLLDVRGALVALLPVFLVWLFAAVSGLCPRGYLWVVTIVFTATALVPLAGGRWTGTVTGVERIVLPWGEAVTVLERTPGTPWLLPLYLLGLSVYGFGLVAARALRPRDRTGAVLVAIAAIASLTSAILAFAIDVLGLALPYLANLVGPVFVVLMALQCSRTSTLRDAALVGAERRFRATLDQALQFIGLLDARGTLLEINQTALDFGGVPHESVIGRLFWETVWWTHAPALQAQVRAAVARAAAGELVRFESTHPGPDGRPHHVETTITPVRDASGVVTLLISEGRDITARQEAESALRASEARVRRLIENQTDFVVSCAPDLTVSFANDSFCRFLGLAPEQVVGRPLPSCLGPPAGEEVRACVAARTRDEPVFTCRVLALAAGGEGRWTEWTGCALYDPGGRPLSVQMTGRDVHDRVVAEEENRQIERRIVESQKMEALGQLAGGISHDFNNLLTVITGRSDMLLAEYAGTPARARLLQIRQAAGRAASMTRQLLAFSRQSPLHLQVVSLNGVVDEMQALLRQAVGERVALAVRTSPGLSRVQADPDQLGRVILNLAVNARDAMPGGGELRIETADVTLDESAGRLAALAPGRYVRLIVSDTGRGMTEEVRSRLFEPFFTTKGPERGTGLGLAVADGIIRQSGGAIDVESAPGRGTTFTIHLPAVDGVARAADREPASRTAGGGTETLLLVEDEPAVREMTATALQRLGYTVLSAATGEEALALARRHHGEVALVITDVVMPGMRGPEMAERLRLEQPGVAVLFMSGYTADTELLRDIETGEAPFLQKPFSLAALAAKVRELLDARPPR